MVLLALKRWSAFEHHAVPLIVVVGHGKVVEAPVRAVRQRIVVQELDGEGMKPADRHHIVRKRRIAVERVGDPDGRSRHAERLGKVPARSSREGTCEILVRPTNWR